MLFQKIIDSVIEEKSKEYTYEEIQKEYYLMLIPTAGEGSHTERTLENAYNFLKHHKLEPKDLFNPSYKTFYERGVRVISGMFKTNPWNLAKPKRYYYFLLPRSISSRGELNYFSDLAGDYFADRGFIKQSQKRNIFNSSYIIPGAEMKNFYDLKDYDPAEKYDIKSDKARDIFRDILSEQTTFTEKEINMRMALHVPAGPNVEKTKKYATHIQEFLKDSDVKVITARIKSLMAREGDHPFYFILFPEKYPEQELRKTCSELQNHFVELGYTTEKESIDWFPPTGLFPGYRLNEHFKDFTVFDPLAEYKMKSDRAKEAFKGILENVNGKVYTSKMLNSFDFFDLATNKKAADFVFNFLENNPRYKRDFKIAVVKKENNKFPTSYRDDYYFILARKISKDSPMYSRNKRDDFNTHINDEHKRKFGKALFSVGYISPQYKDANKIDYLGKVEEYNLLDAFKMGQKSQELFKDILRENSKKENNRVYTLKMLNNFDYHALSTDKKVADFVYDFLEKNYRLKEDYRIVIVKKENNTSQFSNRKNDIYFILARKTSKQNPQHNRENFNIRLNNSYKEKFGIDLFLDKRYVKYKDAETISYLGKIEDYNPLDVYQMGQKSQELFGEILRESLSNTETKVEFRDLKDTTMAFITYDDSHLRPNLEREFYDFIKDTDLTRYNLDYKTFYEAGFRIIYDDSNKSYHLIIPDDIFNDEVIKSVFDIELDLYLKRKGMEEGQRAAFVKNIYFPTHFRFTDKLYFYHPLMKYGMKSSKAKETFEDIF